MKVRAYLRVAETQRSPGYKVEANSKPDERPLVGGGKILPTAKFALDLDIPDSLFRLSEQVIAEISVVESTELIAAEIHYKDK